VNIDITVSGFAEAADKFADEAQRRGVWERWTNYAIRPQKSGGRYVLAVEDNDPDLQPRSELERALEKVGGRVFRGSTADTLVREAVERRELRRAREVYWPLVRYPDLFLRFARLADEGKLDKAATMAELDTDRNAATAEEWAKKYGVLGLTHVEKDEYGFEGASTYGGEADTVAAFAHQAWVANGCLRLYEAAWTEELDVNLIASYMTPRAKALYMDTPAHAQAFALNTVATETQRKVAGNAYPALYGEVGRFVSGWSFTNLLGAMWLQMFWLLTANEAPRRCWECGEIIPPEPPNQPPGSKKRGRKKEKFCNKTCDNRYRYRTETKPRRQANSRA
jgi:hypothetical protein